MKQNPKTMTAPQLVAEVELHRKLWHALRTANEMRLEAHAEAKAAAELPPPQTTPYIQAHPDRIAACAKAREFDDVFLRTMSEMFRAALD